MANIQDGGLALTGQALGSGEGGPRPIGAMHDGTAVLEGALAFATAHLPVEIDAVQAELLEGANNRVDFAPQRLLSRGRHLRLLPIDVLAEVSNLADADEDVFRLDEFVEPVDRLCHRELVGERHSKGDARQDGPPFETSQDARSAANVAALKCNREARVRALLVWVSVGRGLALRALSADACLAGLNKRIDSVLVHGTSSVLSWILVGIGIPIARRALR